MAEYPQFIWQHEYNKRWTTYTYEECCILNKALSKRQKTVTLPSSDKKKKLNIHFEKMIQKNLMSSYEQRVRCLIYNNGYHSWLWEDDYDNFNSYPPYVTVYLEVAYEKGLKNVDIFIKEEDYDIDLEEWIQKNKTTGHTRKILREKVRVIAKENAENELNFMNLNVACHNFIKNMSREDERSIKQICFGFPALRVETDEIPTQDFVPEGIASLCEVSNNIVQSVAVDSLCPIAEDCNVYSDGSDIYNATLNLTSLQANNNKYFNLQLLENKKKKNYAVWFRWGRVGYNGQNSLTEFKKFEEAKKVFEKKFYDKTHNHFADRANFVRDPSKYDLLHTNFTEVSRTLPTADTKLDSRIQDLLHMICNKKDLEEAAKEMCYDARAIPLGKITAKQINDGYTALKNIAEILRTKGVGKKLIDECSIFYTKIPHDFGRRTPPLIRSLEDVKEKLRMMEALSNICLAMNVLNSSEGLENPIDLYYKSLECNLIPLDKDSEEFQVLNTCVKETHGPSHCFSMEIVDAFKCIKETQESSFKNFGSSRLLFHGSRTSNWLGIIKKGLQIAPKEAPSTGFMFGKGIYFADVSSKSANYCYPTKKKNEGLLLMSEVSLGNSKEAVESEDLSDLPKPFNSVFALGKWMPKNFKISVLSTEATVPCGPLEERSMEDLTLNYNEYIVYDPDQVKMKYLMRVKFSF